MTSWICSSRPSIFIFSGMLVAVVSLAAAGGSWLGGRASAEKPEWKLAIQAWTFNDTTLFDAIDKTKSAGVKYLEAFPGQKISKEDGAGFDENLSPELRAKVKAKLEKEGIKLLNYGVTELGSTEASNRKVFDFAKDMGIETIVAEPDPATFGLLDKLTEEYKINIALHNHPKPSRYWNPDTVLEAVKGHSKRIRACADIGHWMRSGIDPLEAVKKLNWRIGSLHFKDLNEFGKGEAHDVVWGKGKGNVKAILEELNRQHFWGVFSIEYEHNWGKSLPEIIECVKFFNTVAEELSK